MMNAGMFIPDVDRQLLSRSEVKEKLQNLETKYHQESHRILQFFEYSDQSVFIAHTTGEILEVNRHFLLSFEYYEKVNIIGRSLMTLFAENSNDSVLTDVVNLYEHGLIPERKHIFKSFSGQNFAGAIRMVLLTDQFNKTIGILGIIKRERKGIEDIDYSGVDMKELEQVFNHMPSMVFLVDKDINIINLNDTALKITERLKEESIGVRIGNVLRCINSLDSPNGCGHGEKCKSCAIRSTILGTLRSGKTSLKFETSVKMLVNGKFTELTILLSTVYLNGEDEPSVLIAVDDVTERKHMEQKLIKKEKELEAGNERLKKLNHMLKQSYDEIQIYNTRLLKAKEKVEKYNRLKSAFLSNISHEIRTPLNGIVGFAELLTRTDSSDERRLEYTEIIRDSSSRLLSIINDLMDVSQIESGDIEITNSEFNINELFNEIYQSYFQEVNEKELSFRINSLLTDSQKHLYSDREKLSRVFYHLINNSLKFTDSGHIELGVKVEDESVHFYIKDTGVGISKELIEEIFEHFRKGEDEKSRFKTGVGVGLSLSKAYVELLGGEITIISEPEKGTVVNFTVPFRQMTKEDIEVSFNHGVNYNGIDWTNKTILIVEDEEYNYIYLKEVLKHTKAYVIHSTTAKLAIEICKSVKKIDAVLLDIKLPDMSGYNVASYLMAHKRDTVVIAQTAYAQESDKEKALQFGCTDYLAKPIVPRILIEKLKQYFNK